MFIEVHTANATSGPKLAFLKSLNIQAFPCSRRRSMLVDLDRNNDEQIKDDEKYYIPYDPEARLNTEANNRQHTGINGYTQSFIKSWDDSLLSLVLGGYLFKINTPYTNLDTSVDCYDAFGKMLIDSLGESNPTAGLSIYANIRVEEVPLYSGFTTYYTSILRDQATTGDPSASIDILKTGMSTGLAASAEFKRNPENYYYFAGLSLSTEPLASDTTNPTIKESETEESPKQRTISLRILDLVEGPSANVWKLHQPALLPKIQHGDTENSVKLDTIYATNILCQGNQVPALDLDKIRTEDNGDEIYKLSFVLN